MSTPCWDASTPLIPVVHQPTVLLDHARDIELPADELLAGSGLAASDLARHDCHLAAPQYLALLGRLADAAGSAETAFALGSRLLPGHFGLASHALLQAGSLGEAIDVLMKCPTRLSPLLVPHRVVEGDLAVLYFTDACSLGCRRSLVVEMQFAAMASMCRWLGQAELPWTFCFNRTAARGIEQHEVHLGPQLRFNCHLDAMLIDASHLHRPWPRRGAGPTAASSLLQAARAEAGPCSLLGALYDLLLEHIRQPPTLEDCAMHFGVSASTFKRRLALLGTHFQAELDRVRSHVALHLFRFRGCDNEAVARHLGFHDATNFRRSFKRWTGLTPGLLRAGFAGVMPG